jgi:GH15 family glucan-1,4-alpha-glucosidase
MPPHGDAPSIVRIVEGLSGRVAVRSQLVIRFGYGQTAPTVSRAGDALVATAGRAALSLRTPAPTRADSRAAVSKFEVAEAERVAFTLTWVPRHTGLAPSADPQQALRETEEFWGNWSAQCAYDGPYREAVLRSLVVLKGLTYRPTGGIVAAATTSLPEWPGGVRNWDYRYCWLRDAALTLRALVDAGYVTEAEQWRSWLVRAAGSEPVDPQIMYDVAGERNVPERHLDWLPGFEHSRPVRTGNAAADQVQIDVYGEVMDAMYQARRHKLGGSVGAWNLGKHVLTLLEDRWREPDEGIWEVRGERQHFTHSKAMAWAAFDRGIKMCEEFGLDGPIGRWRATRDEIHTQVCREAWNGRLGSFTQAYGSERLDASLLLLPLIGFLPPDDYRIRSTLECVQKRLSRGGFLLRYHSEEAVDGLPAGEGAFLPSSFWLVDALTRDGRHDEATDLFKRLLEIRNDVGLLAEEYDPERQRQLGNFPQALSHLALINSAVNLANTSSRGTGQNEAAGQISTMVAPPTVSATRMLPLGDSASWAPPLAGWGRLIFFPVRNLLMRSFTMDCVSRT